RRQGHVDVVRAGARFEVLVGDGHDDRVDAGVVVDAAKVVGGARHQVGEGVVGPAVAVGDDRSPEARTAVVDAGVGEGEAAVDRAAESKGGREAGHGHVRGGVVHRDGGVGGTGTAVIIGHGHADGEGAVWGTRWVIDILVVGTVGQDASRQVQGRVRRAVAP